MRHALHQFTTREKLSNLTHSKVQANLFSTYTLLLGVLVCISLTNIDKPNLSI